MSTERPPRESSTVMLIRDGLKGLEVFMVRRHLNSDFVGGAYVFPGGSLDAEDCDPLLLRRYSGIDASRAAAALGLPPERALGHWGAAVRETFEEAGVLLARRSGDFVDLFKAPSPEHWRARREALLDGTLGWAELLETEDLQLTCEQVIYFSHWITPEGTPKRFTTRFFLAVLPSGQQPFVDDREVEAGVWVRPAEALEQHAMNKMTMIFPTLRTLEELAGFADTQGAVAACRDRRVITNLPRMVEREGSIRVLLPTDAGYEEAARAPALPFDPGSVRGV